MQNPKELLNKLGLSDAETAICLCMSEGGVRVSEIQKRTGLKRPTVYYALQRLAERGIVFKTGKERGRFAFDPNALLSISEDQVRKAAAVTESLNAWTERILTHQRLSVAEKPSVSFYEGEAAVRQVIRDTLYAKSAHIDSLAPENNFFKELGNAFVAEYVNERNHRAIRTRNLWERRIDASVFQTLYEGHADVRVLPSVMQGTFETTMFLYDDRTLYISSRQNAYALLVHSPEHHRFMSAIFNGLWSASVPHETDANTKAAA